MDRDSLDKNAASSLKKILSSGGTVKGAFYFAADSKLKDAGVIIYLASKAAKADSEGKKLRKSIASARFARGVVDVHNSRPLFIVHNGNASPELLKKACKTVLSKRDGLRFLSRALARLAEAQGVEEDELEENEADKKAIAASLELTPEEEAELKALEDELDASEVGQDAEAIFKSFLSADTAEQELVELNAERLADTTAKEAALERLPRPSPEWDAAYEELREARFAFAETNYAGPDPFPEIGEELDEAARATMSAAIEGTMRFLRAQLQRVQIELEELTKLIESGDIAMQDVRDRHQSRRATASSYQRQLEALEMEMKESSASTPSSSTSAPAT